MRFWRSIVLAALVIGALAQSAPAADAPQPAGTKENAPKAKSGSMPERRAWMFGIGYGVSGARFIGKSRIVSYELRSDTPTENPTALFFAHPDWDGSDFETAGNLNLRLAYAISPRLSFGFERKSWSKDIGDNSWHFELSSMAATVYPSAGHVFFRGGAGIARTEAIGNTAVERSLAQVGVRVVSPFFLQHTDAGFGLEAATGVEYRFWRRISVAPELSIRYLTFGDGIFTEMAGATVGLNLWF